MIRMSRLNPQIMLGFRKFLLYRMQSLLMFFLMTLSAHSAVYMTEVSTDADNAYVELFNSSDTIALMNGWKIKCGSNIYEFHSETKIAEEKVLVVDFDLSFFRGDTVIILYDAYNQLIDRFAINNLKFKRKGESYQRDIVAIQSEMYVKTDESPIRLAECTKGYLPLLKEVDRNTFVFTKDPTNPSVTHGDFPVKEYSVISVVGQSSVEYQDMGKHISVSPNPCQTTLSITCSTQGQTEYQLSDIHGRVVCEGDFEGQKELDMTCYQVGVYMLTVGGETIKVEKK